VPTAKKEIQDILLDPAFQPRSQPKGFTEELYRYFIEWVAPVWNELRERLSKSFKDSGVSATMPEWLQDAIVTCAEWGFFVLKACVITAFLWLAIRELQALFKKGKQTDVFLSRKTRAPEIEEPLEPYLQRGDFLQYLIKFRRKLRREVLSKINRSPSTPDRSLVAVLDSVEKERFQETAACYERVVLAGRPLDPQEIMQLNRARGSV
jgi:hypothetical protein